MLENILCVFGKSGLFKLISRGKNMFIVESLLTHKRTPISLKDKITSLDKIAIYTEVEEIPVSTVFDKIKKKENGQEINSEFLNAEKEGLNDYFGTILPNYDRKRVYPSHIKKILSWYNLLIKEGLTDFINRNEENENTETTDNI